MINTCLRDVEILYQVAGNLLSCCKLYTVDHFWEDRLAGHVVVQTVAGYIDV